MSPRPDAQEVMLSSHEDRVQNLETGLRNLEVSVATTGANLQALSTRLDTAVNHIGDKIDDLKSSLGEKVHDLQSSLDSIVKKEEKFKAKWVDKWMEVLPRIVIYFVTSILGALGAVATHAHLMSK